MHKNDFFNFQRFINLCKHAIGKDGKDIISIGWKLLVIFFILTVLFIITGNRLDIIHSIYVIVVIFSGIHCALHVFNNLNDKDSCISWLMIPGSAFEKFLSRVLYVLVIYFVLLSIVYSIAVNIALIFAGILFGTEFQIFIPFNDIGFSVGYGIYLVIISIFFTGGLYYRKNAFIKTILFILLFSVIINMIIMTLGVVIIVNEFESFVQYFPEIARCWFVTGQSYFKIIIFIIIPVFCWLISFVRMKEKSIVEIECRK